MTPTRAQTATPHSPHAEVASRLSGAKKFSRQTGRSCNPPKGMLRDGGEPAMAKARIH